MSFSLGSLTTLLAGAGAVISHEQTAKELAALAGVSSGTRAEFNSSYFQNITVDVVGKGIDSARSQTLSDIKTKTHSSFIDYTVEEAISDAIQYHAICNVISGLQEASRALTKQELDLGVSSLARTYGAVRQVASPESDDLRILLKRSQDVNPIEYSLKAESHIAQLKAKQSSIDALNPILGSTEELEKNNLSSEISSLFSELESGYLSAAVKQVTEKVKDGWPKLIAKINLSQGDDQRKVLVSQLQAEVSSAEKRQVDINQLLVNMKNLIFRSDKLIGFFTP